MCVFNVDCSYSCGTFNAMPKIDNRGTGSVKFVCLLSTTRVSILGCALRNIYNVNEREEFMQETQHKPSIKLKKKIWF